MIATGEYAELAKLTAPALQWALGINVGVFAPTGDPCRAKLTLPDDEQYLFVDADVLFIRKVVLPQVPHAAFAGIRALAFERGLKDILAKYPANPSLFVNTGFFIASDAHRDVMKRAREIFDERQTKLAEETALNIALQETEAERMALSPRLCPHQDWQAGCASGHMCAVRGVRKKLIAIRYLAFNHAPAGLREILGIPPRPKGREGTYLARAWARQGAVRQLPSTQVASLPQTPSGTHRSPS